ncbi:hypothetical protein CEK26_000376 [Fusarium fujikuroi]|nr:hypothetical protein CEK27_000374 [Fusarium fujikuroi]QGI75468.1 hypothetical protein CEK25_000374 [Fusarium fujikuroi]QGI89161.1 hypothetical protein CEK26_000376 [Fusarium fujikuroi]VZH91018.1 unnamed protein product [Fusarium fujikuroi]
MYKFWRDDIPVAAVELKLHGDLGRFQGFFGSIWTATFTCVGPEFVSMIVGEAKFRAFISRMPSKTYTSGSVSFLSRHLYVYPTLIGIVNGGDSVGIGAASPYVITMGNLGIGLLPHIVNGLLFSSVFSAGNALTHHGTRSFTAWLLRNKPKFLLKCTSFGLCFVCLGIEWKLSQCSTT